MTQHDGRYDRETCAHSPEYSCDIECDLRAIAISRATQLEQMRRERDEARAKLARIREMPALRYETATTACEALADIIRIIDEKEGGQ